jgi:hypothetical protein
MDNRFKVRGNQCGKNSRKSPTHLIDQLLGPHLVELVIVFGGPRLVSKNAFGLKAIGIADLEL